METQNNYKKATWSLVLLLLGTVYAFYFKGVSYDKESRKEMKELNSLIKDLRKENESLMKEIKQVKDNIVLIDENISKIEGQKTIIKQIYHEKITSVNQYTDAQLDSFFTDRYRYYSY